MLKRNGNYTHVYKSHMKPLSPISIIILCLLTFLAILGLLVWVSTGFRIGI